MDRPGRLPDADRRAPAARHAELYMSAVPIREMRLKYDARCPAGARKSRVPPEDVHAGHELVGEWRMATLRRDFDILHDAIVADRWGIAGAQRRGRELVCDQRKTLDDGGSPARLPEGVGI